MIDLIEGRTLIHGLTMENSILKEKTKIITEDSITEDSITEDSITEDSITEDSITEDSITEDSIIEKEFESFIEETTKSEEILVLEEPKEIIKKVSTKKKKEVSN